MIFKIFRIKGDKFQEFDLKLGDDIAPTEVELSASNNQDNDFVLAGFYKDAQRYGGLKGIFYANVDDKEGVINIKKHGFEDGFLHGLATNREIKKDQGLSSSFKIKNFIYFGDGSLGFIAENSYQTESTSVGAGNDVRNNIFYHYRDIIIPRFHKNGDLIDIIKVPKSIVSSARGMTYLPAISKGKIYLIFNDDKDREERDGKNKWRYTDLVVINLENGKIAFNETLFNSNEIDLEFTPFMSDFNKDYLLINTLSLKKYAFGLIKLD